MNRIIFNIKVFLLKVRYFFWLPLSDYEIEKDYDKETRDYFKYLVLQRNFRHISITLNLIAITINLLLLILSK